MPNHTQLFVKDGQLALYSSILTFYCDEKVIFICPPSSSIIILLFFPFIPPCWCTRLWRRIKTQEISTHYSLRHLTTEATDMIQSWSCAPWVARNSSNGSVERYQWRWSAYSKECSCQRAYQRNFKSRQGSDIYHYFTSLGFLRALFATNDVAVLLGYAQVLVVTRSQYFYHARKIIYLLYLVTIVQTAR